MPGEPLLGLHVSIEKSLDLAIDRAQEVGCTTFQMFTRNPRSWRFKSLDHDQAELFREKRKKAGFRTIVAHMPYLPNLASSNRTTMQASRLSLSEEVKRCDALGIDYLVAHLGSHMGVGAKQGVRNVAEAVDLALASSEGDTTVVLENMAGQKNSVGSRFEELRLILDTVKGGDRTAVCLDTCHAYAAGFDLSGAGAVEQSMAVIEETVGFDSVKVIHLNDSRGGLGSCLDRHEDIGRGKIGTKGMKAFLRYKGVTERPLIMETPHVDLKGMKKSVSLLRSLLK